MLPDSASGVRRHARFVGLCLELITVAGHVFEINLVCDSQVGGGNVHHRQQQHTVSKFLDAVLIGLTCRRQFQVKYEFWLQQSLVHNTRSAGVEQKPFLKKFQDDDRKGNNCEANLFVQYYRDMTPHSYGWSLTVKRYLS